MLPANKFPNLNREEKTCTQIIGRQKNEVNKWGVVGWNLGHICIHVHVCKIPGEGQTMSADMEDAISEAEGDW